MTSGLVLGCASGLTRIMRRRSLAAAAAALGMVALVAISERRAALFGAANRVLEGEVFGFILPIALVFASRRAIAPLRLDAAATPLARFGASRRTVALGLVLASMIGAVVLASVFAFGATFGAQGAGRWWALAADYALGSTSGVGALFAPRAHIQNLLGGEPPMFLGQSLSTACLAAIIVAFTTLALLRCPP